jgi:hypothetical protein
LGAVLDGGRLIDEDNKIYNFARGADFTLTLSRLGFLSDNGSHGGIHFTEAWNKPWTMDDRNLLQWRVTVPDTAIDSGWENVEEGGVINNVFNTENGALTGLSEDRDYSIIVELRDSMGNISQMGDVPETVVAKFRIVGDAPARVTNLSAACNSSGNQITIRWTTPSGVDMYGAELNINGQVIFFEGTGLREHRISVPRIGISGVRNGLPVNLVNRYNISVRASNAAGLSPPMDVSIWNIPGMDINSTSVLLTQENFSTELIADNRTYTLTGNVILDTWTPLAGEFTGKFYGNGHSVTIRNLTTDTKVDVNEETVTAAGLFGIVNNGLVRDLTVVYERIGGTAVEINPTITTVFGGIAAQATGNSQLLNVLVKGSFHLNMQGVDTPDVNNRHIFAGGITGVLGRMPFSEAPPSRATIQNAYSSLDLEVSRINGIYDVDDDHSILILVGGITGAMGRPGLGDGEGDPVVVQNISIVGNITVGGENKTAWVGITHYSPGLFVGGLAGSITGEEIRKAELLNCDYRNGNIDVYNDTGPLAVGGAVGILHSNAKISDCISRGGGSAQKNEWGFSFSVGGFIGEIGGYTGFNGSGTIENCYGVYSIYVIGSDHVGKTTPATTTPTIIAGGFVGEIRIIDGEIKIQHSYAIGNVEAKNYSSIYAGGFAGAVRGNASILSCYAAGDVYATVYRAVSMLSVGGFVGEGPSFNNCYALGDVIALKEEIGQKESDFIFYDYIGGFAGYLYNGDGLDRCFAKGNITAQRNIGAQLTTSSDDHIYVGGLVGRVEEARLEYDQIQPIIKNSAALNQNITVTGQPGNSYVSGILFTDHLIGRVVGYSPITNPSHDAYAYDKLKLFKSDTYNDHEPEETNDTHHRSVSGTSTLFSQFMSTSFWINTLNFNSATGFGSLTNVWNFSRLYGKGHPILNGADGKPMPGQ